jgi:flagellar hook-basal body complex protein FliE
MTPDEEEKKDFIAVLAQFICDIIKKQKNPEAAKNQVFSAINAIMQEESSDD